MRDSDYRMKGRAPLPAILGLRGISPSLDKTTPAPLKGAGVALERNQNA